MNKEIALGLGLGILLFTVLQGLDILPFFLVGFLIYMLYERGGFKIIGQRLGENASNNTLTRITFDQIGGKVPKELEALDFIKTDKQVADLGIRPQGILLTGPETGEHF